MFQYYEMSYGLNVEMHKQVCFILFYLYFTLVYERALHLRNRN